MLELPWYEIYILPRKTTLESKAREFQHKLLNRTVYFRFSRAAMFGVQKSSEKSLWEFVSIIMQNLSDILPLLCTRTWPVSSRVKTKNTNKILHKMGKTITPLSSFCGQSNESLEHLFICYEFACSFWLSVTNWLEGMVCM